MIGFRSNMRGFLRLRPLIKRYIELLNQNNTFTQTFGIT